MANNSKLPKEAWKEINPASLSPAAVKAWDAYKAQYKVAKAARDAFEAILTKAAELPATHRLVFSYQFGKLSMAIDLAKTEGASKKAVDFATLKV